MTLVETLIATGIGTVILTAVMSISLFSARSFASLGNYVDLDIKSRQALDLMSQEIRQVDALTSYATNQLIFAGTETNGTAYTLSYTYAPIDQTVTRTKTEGGGTASKVLLTGCTYLKFDMFQRSPQTSTYDLYTASSPATCKLIQLTWVCSRDVLGGRLSNTESVQSAKVVIRKE